MSYTPGFLIFCHIFLLDSFNSFHEVSISLPKVPGSFLNNYSPNSWLNPFPEIA